MSLSARAAAGAIACLSLGMLVAEGCAPKRVAVPGRPLAQTVGYATFYGPGFHGQLTASGVRFDQNRLVAAHPSYPFGTRVRVTALESGRSVVVRIIDRGPASGPRSRGTIIDLSKGAASRLRMIKDGRIRVRVEVLEWGERR
jgi:rare lipoprotein A